MLGERHLPLEVQTMFRLVCFVEHLQIHDNIASFAKKNAFVSLYAFPEPPLGRAAALLRTAAGRPLRHRLLELTKVRAVSVA